MNETIERLKYYRYFCEKTIDVEAFDTAIKALELLPELVETLEQTSKWAYDDSAHIATELIQRAKELMGE
jgi:hypothetical protein